MKDGQLNNLVLPASTKSDMGWRGHSFANR